MSEHETVLRLLGCHLFTLYSFLNLLNFKRGPAILQKYDRHWGPEHKEDSVIPWRGTESTGDNGGAVLV